MKLEQEREELFYSFPLDLSNEEAKKLRDFGLQVIVKDDDALINYAVNYILSEEVNRLENKEQLLKKLIKKEKKEKEIKNGKSDS